MKNKRLFLIISLLSFFCGINKVNADYVKDTWTKSNAVPSLTIRSEAKSSSSSITKVLFGTDLKIVEGPFSGSGCSNGWYKVIYDGINTGYACSNYINSVEEITLNDEAYCNQLKTAGFPDSYCPYLSYIHSKHPSWIFTPSVTNLDWASVIDGEEYKNYINTSIESYRKNNTVMESDSWYTVADSVNAYMLDPRNMLMEKTLFMFENLSYNATYQTSEVVKSIFGSSYLSSDYYVNLFMTAGSTNLISPVHLAARVVQEGGSKETYGSVSGTYESTYRDNSLYGYYNYYNIGAYADKYTNSPVTRGLAYAKGLVGGDPTLYGRPWTSRELAIAGGAQFLANTYINKGQNTLYYQKFNTAPNAAYSNFTHQYMANVTAPLTEGNNTYGSYSDLGLLENAYEFLIPVYTNMPAFTNMPSVANNNSFINSISINDVIINGFDPYITTYRYVVDMATTSINLSAVPVNGTTTITGTGVITLTDVETNVNIYATAENGSQRSYLVTIIRSDDKTSLQDLVNSMSVKINNNILTNISPGTTVEAINASVLKISNRSVVSITDSEGNVVTTGALKTGYKINIQSAINETGNYNIAIKGDNNGDGEISIVDLLRTRKHILGEDVLSDAYGAACDANSDGTVTIVDLLMTRKHILGEESL